MTSMVVFDALDIAIISRSNAVLVMPNYFSFFMKVIRVIGYFGATLIFVIWKQKAYI